VNKKFKAGIVLNKIGQTIYECETDYLALNVLLDNGLTQLVELGQISKENRIKAIANMFADVLTDYKDDEIDGILTTFENQLNCALGDIREYYEPEHTWVHVASDRS
jgi:hypothetical protein